MFVRPSVLRREIAAIEAQARTDNDELARLRALVEDIRAITGAVNTPNGTTNKIKRLIENA
jgi:hypothetical protein